MPSKYNTTKQAESITTKHKGFFAWLPNEIVYEWDLSSDALAAALYLHGKPDGWQTRPFDVRRRFGWGERIWYRVSAELKACGLLHEKVTANGTELWFELPDLKLNIEKKPTRRFVDPTKPDPTKRQALSNKDLPNKDLLTKKENNVLSIKKSNLSKEEAQQIFDRMWEKYPLKRAKQKAEETLYKLLKDKPRDGAEKLAQEIWGGLMACIQEHAAKTELKEQGADIFVPCLPHLTTWLNQARWQDEYQHPDMLLQQAKPKNGGINLGAIESQWR